MLNNNKKYLIIVTIITVTINDKNNRSALDCCANKLIKIWAPVIA
jgi:hypothetical protein